jgi:eukaryotic-like serine/threonine-protein kinase
MATFTGTASVSRPGTSSEPSHEPERGMQLGRYELLHRIASGGMAQVWAARQTGDFGFSRACAVKVIRPEMAGSKSFRSMFLDEARLAAKIRHPHVVEVFDLGEQGPIVFQVMELVEGDTLSALLRGADDDELHPMDPAMVARIMSDMASGLHAAHELKGEDGAPLQLVHRDVSPQNILVSIDGVTKLADFGIAKALGRLAEETDAGQVKGKFSYLAPEQAARRSIDRRSDVFAAGIVLWEALTGKRLFRGADAIDTLSRVLRGKIDDPRAYVPSLPSELVAVTMKALEREPENRYQTARDLSEALDEAAQAARITMSARQVGAAVSARVAGRVGAQRKAIATAAIDITLGTAPATSNSPLKSFELKRSRNVMIAAAFFAFLVGAGWTVRSQIVSNSRQTLTPLSTESNVALAPAPSSPAASASSIASVVGDPSTSNAPAASSSIRSPASTRRIAPNKNKSTAPPKPTLPFRNPY